VLLGRVGTENMLACFAIMRLADQLDAVLVWVRWVATELGEGLLLAVDGFVEDGVY